MFCSKGSDQVATKVMPLTGNAKSSFPVVYFGPDVSDTDPYPALLAEAVGPTVRTVPATPEEAGSGYGEGKSSPIYHLQFEEAFLASSTGLARRDEAQKILDQLEAFRVSGGHLIWTMRDPVETTQDDDPLLVEFRQGLNDLASVLHLHSWDAVEELRDVSALDLTRVTVIPQGGYIPHFRVWPGPRARARLGIEEDVFTFAVFDGLNEFAPAEVSFALEAFRALDDDRIRLILSCCDDDLAGSDERIINAGNDGSREDMTVGLAAADAVLIPKVSGLSSGTAVLAGNVGRGVIGPDLAAVRSVITNGRTGALHEVAETDGLRRMMSRALREGREVWAGKGASAASAAAAKNWDVIGRQWRSLYTSLGLLPRYRLLDTAEIVVQ